MEGARFTSTMSGFRPDEMLRSLRATFVVALLVGAGLHVGAVLVSPPRTTERAPEPTTRFLRRPLPSRTPFVSRQVPRPSRETQVIGRRTVAPRAWDGSVGAAPVARPATALDPAQPLEVPWDKPSTDLRDSLPALTQPDIQTMRQPHQQVDLTLELLSLSNLMEGDAWAMVIQDPDDKQRIKGFLKLAQVISARDLGQPSSAGTSIDAVLDLVRESTGLSGSFEGLVTFDDPRLLDMPILVAPGPTTMEAEMSHVADYLKRGGFIYGATIDRYGEGLEKYGGLTRGRDFWVERLPATHPVFSAFFDIRGDVCLMGHLLKGRLIGIAPCSGVPQTGPLDRLTVNVILHALTQEGSITQREMAGVRW